MKKSGTVNLYLDGKTIYIASNFNDAIVFVNGKDTGITVKDARNFGPVSTDGSMRIHVEKEFPWGKSKSEEVAITKENSSYELRIDDMNEKAKESIMTATMNAEKSFYEAISSLESSKLANLDESIKGQLEEQINRVKEDNRMYVGKGPIKMIFDLDSFELGQADGNFHVRVVANLIEEGDVVSKDASKEVIEDATANEDSTFYRYALVYDSESEEWIIHSGRTMHDYDINNKKEFMF